MDPRDIINASFRPVDPVKERQVAQMSLFGNVLNMWAQTELVIEMVVKEELGLTTEQACIICGPLGGGAKTSLLYSLLRGKPEREPFVEAVRKFQTLTGRNALAHGFLTFNKIDEPWTIVSREVKNGLQVRTKTLMRYLEDDFLPAFDAVMDASGFNDEQIHRYGLEIAALALPA